MPTFDYRTKPESAWTFYVVDHLPTMSNLYRFDTVQEAIDQYKSLPDHLRSAIGSSFYNRREIDHIHRIDGQAVLIRDMDRMKDSLWRDSTVIADAVKLMREQLHVEYELSTDMFGSQRGSVAIPVMDGPCENMLHPSKMLDPKVPDRPLSAINEVFVEKCGWIPMLQFLEEQESRTWSREHGYRVPFVNNLNIRYMDRRGHMGQVDVKPADYFALCDAYKRSQDRKPGLDERIAGADAKLFQQAASQPEKTPSDRTM